jgi:DNA polymerase-3 subunit alpha
MTYINLHVHTDSSHLDGLNDIPRLIKRLKEINHKACAISDHGNVCNVLKFYRACIENEIKPLLGFEAYMSHNHTQHSKAEIELEVENTGDDFIRYQNHIVLLAKNNEGYKNLLKLTTIGYTDGFYKKPTIDFELLKKYSEGVICINGHVGTDIARAFERYCNPVSLLENQIKSLFGFRNNDELISAMINEPEIYCNSKELNLLTEPYGGSKVNIEDVITEQKTIYAQREFTRAYEITNKYYEVFGEDYYLEIQNHGLNIEKQVIPLMIEMSNSLNIKLVMTNDSHYTWREDAEAHRVHMSNGLRKTLAEFMQSDFEGFKDSDEFYIKTDEEMLEMASQYGSYAIQALTNTLEVAEKCNVDIEALKFGGTFINSKGKLEGKWSQKEYFFPNFTIPAPYVSVEEYFKKLVREGLEDRRKDEELYSITMGISSYDKYLERLEYEMSVILDMGFPTYFLILWDVFKFCRDSDIPVGKGRGSGAGSLVLYSLKITDIDPLPYELIFERFLNPSRVSLPDVDCDFCYDRIGEVVDYVKGKYGEEYVCKIGTFGTLGAKSVLKDASRVLEYPFDKINDMTRLVTDISISIEKMLKEYKEIKLAYDNDSEFKRVVDVARRLEGLQRHTSQHAAGLVISPFPLTNMLPLKGEHNDLTSQWEMGDIELLGFVKMDFLKLRTLTVVKNTLKSIEKNLGLSIDINKIPLDDQAVYDEFHKGNSLAIFQFESDGIRALLKKNKPNSLEDLTVLNALYRPGPLDAKVEDEDSPHFGKTMVDLYCERASGSIPVEYDHPLLEQVLSTTYGIITFQEQIMRLSVVLAGFSLPDADELRKVVAKKLPEKMPAQKEKFFKGCLEHQGFIDGCAEMDKLPMDVVEHIWKQIEAFARYGFPKAHACAYADLAYRAMWLKVHYPQHYMACVLTSWMGKVEELVPYLNECRRMGIKILPPEINRSTNVFVVSADATGIHFGLTGIKGVGEKAVENILETKEKHEIRNLSDFITLTGSSVNKTVVSSLIKCGAFDFLGHNRRTLLQSAEELLEINAKIKTKIASNKKRKVPVADIGSFYNPLYDYEISEIEDFSSSELCIMEKELAGFYMAHHPLDGFIEYIKSKSTNTSTDINLGIECPIEEYDYALNASEEARYIPLPQGQTIITGGLIKQLTAITIKSGRSKGKQMASFIVEDAYEGDIRCTAFPEIYSKFKNTIREGNVVLIRGNLDYYRENAQVSVNEVKEISIDSAIKFNNTNMPKIELLEIEEMIRIAEETIDVIGTDLELISAVCEELLDLYDRRSAINKLG